MTKTMTMMLCVVILLGGYGCQTTPERVSDEYIELAATKAATMTLLRRCEKSAYELVREHERLKHILDSHYEDFNRERGME